MTSQNAVIGATGYQADLFNPNPVITKPAPGRQEPLEELCLVIGDVRATARKYIVAKKTVYHVVFSDQRKPLVVTLAPAFSGKDFWTSIPEGRQKEAEMIGNLIEISSREQQPFDL